MSRLGKEDSGWVLSRVWLDALEDTARDFFGSRPQIFCRRAYEHATESWLRILERDYGLRHRPATTIKEAVESYIDLGVRGGLFADRTQYELTEITPTRLAITVFKCPYFQSCAHLLEEGVAITNLTCPRLGCFAAAAKLLAQIDCHHEVHTVHIEGGCMGTVFKA